MCRKRRRATWGIISVVAVMFWITSAGLTAASSNPLDVATEYIASNDWDMALYVLDKIKTDSSDSVTRLSATVWKLVVLKSLSDADYITATLLGEARDKAYGDNKTKLSTELLKALNSAIKYGEATVPELEQLLGQNPPRKVALEFPPSYQFIIPDEGDTTQIRLDCGIFPGELAIERMTREKRSFSVPYTLEKWTGDSSLHSALFRGNVAFSLDLAKVYLALGTYFDGSTDDLEARVSRLCLEAVLRFTEDEPYCKERLEALKLLGR